MTDQTHDFATTTEMMDRLAAAAWDALATTAPRDLSLATIAADAAIDAGAARAIAGNVTTLSCTDSRNWTNWRSSRALPI